jgi:hypothetical protein
MRSLLFILSFLLFSCAPETSSKESDFNSSIKSFSKESCMDESCAKVKFTWPEFEEGEIGNRLNQAIQDQLLIYFYSDSIGKTMEEQADIYLNSFLETTADFPDMPGSWEMEINAEVSFDSLKTLTVFFEEYNYSGGAHPNSSNYFMNFDRSTGEFLSVDRLVVDQAALLSMAENAFREFHEVDEGSTLEESGLFFLPETGFFLPNAIGFSRDKFRLIYIPYEIGPYAMGYTELEFSLDEVKGIVRF